MTLQQVTTDVLSSSLAVGRNRLHNPFMSIDQANEGTSQTMSNNTNFYSADRWSALVNESTFAGTHTIQTIADAPTSLTGGNSIKYTHGTGETTQPGDYGILYQIIEGYNITDFAWGTSSAVPVSLQFWVKASITGTFSAYFSGLDSTRRNYVQTFSIGIANTWTQITILNILGDGTAGAGDWIVESSAASLQVGICFGCGSTYQTTNATWETGIFFGTSSNTNLMNTTNATFQITGLQLEVGTVCSQLERRPYQQELAICQRYFEKSYDIGVKPGTGLVVGYASFAAGTTVANTQYYGAVSHKITKRADPITTVYSFMTGALSTVSNGSGTDLAAGSGNPINPCMTNFLVNNNSGTTVTAAANTFIFHWTSDARL
jgi:hypothetical protein